MHTAGSQCCHRPWHAFGTTSVPRATLPSPKTTAAAAAAAVTVYVEHDIIPEEMEGIRLVPNGSIDRQKRL
jgi:hypothetical protein